MSVQDPQRPQHRLIERLHATRVGHRARGRAYRALFMVAGAVVTLGGVAMLVLPGPALAVIPIGLFMLAMEFTWAERLLERAVDRAELAKQTAQETSTRQRLLAGAAAALLVAAGVATALLWDVPILPV